jgi:hypothetical protein
LQVATRRGPCVRCSAFAFRNARGAKARTHHPKSEPVFPHSPPTRDADMDREKLERTWIPHIRTQFERGRPILFTGAGFSSGAKNILGEPIPIASDLKQRLWTLCYPGSAFEESCSLQDLYEDALGKHRKGVTDLLLSHLTPEPASLPEWYREIFSMPWCRAYTLNVDDIENAVSYRYDLPRKPLPISATRPTTHASGSTAGGTVNRTPRALGRPKP